MEQRLWPELVRLLLDDFRVVGVSRAEISGLSCLYEDKKGSYLQMLCDVSDPDAVRQLKNNLVSSDWIPDIVIHAAATPFPKCAIEDTGWEAYEKQFHLAVRASHSLVREFLPNMKRNGWGRFIAVSSTATMTYPVGYSTYTTAKAALEAFYLAIAVEQGPFGITSNVVAPGRILGGGKNEKYQGIVDFVPSRRMGSPKDVGGVIKFLCQDESSFVNGEIIRVDGGLAVSERGRIGQ